MKWEIVARVKVTSGTTFNFTTRIQRAGFATFSVLLGPGRRLRCTCKRMWTHLPDQVELPEDADTCLHIKLLYGNGRVEETTALARALGGTRVTHGTVYLTPLGHEKFDWRYVAHALKETR